MLADHLFFIIPPATATSAPALIALAFVIGTALGSFVQAAALRLNRDEDIIFAPSACAVAMRLYHGGRICPFWAG